MKKKICVCLFQKLGSLNWFPAKHTLYSPYGQCSERNVSLKLVPGNQQCKTALYFMLLKVVFERCPQITGLFALKVLTWVCIFLHFHSSFRLDQKADIFFLHSHSQ